jgi:hypothetical protein
MLSDIVFAILSLITLASCVFALYSALAPIVTIEEDKHDDLES